MKYLVYSSLLSIIFMGSLSASPIYEKLWVGMSLKSFNDMDQCTYIEKQEKKKYLTHYGIIKRDSDYKEVYVPMKSKLWSGYQAKFQNNELREFGLQAKKALTKDRLQAIFSNLIKWHGSDFSIHHFSSFGKKGYSVSWNHENVCVSLKMTLKANNRAMVSIKKAFSREIQPRSNLGAEAVLALSPLLGEGFDQINAVQVANND